MNYNYPIKLEIYTSIQSANDYHCNIIISKRLMCNLRDCEKFQHKALK